MNGLTEFSILLVLIAPGTDSQTANGYFDGLNPYLLQSFQDFETFSPLLWHNLARPNSANIQTIDPLLNRRTSVAHTVNVLRNSNKQSGESKHAISSNTRSTPILGSAKLQSPNNNNQYLSSSENAQLYQRGVSGGNKPGTQLQSRKTRFQDNTNLQQTYQNNGGGYRSLGGQNVNNNNEIYGGQFAGGFDFNAFGLPYLLGGDFNELYYPMSPTLNSLHDQVSYAQPNLYQNTKPTTTANTNWNSNHEAANVLSSAGTLQTGIFQDKQHLQRAWGTADKVQQYNGNILDNLQGTGTHRPFKDKILLPIPDESLSTNNQMVQSPPSLKSESNKRSQTESRTNTADQLKSTNMAIELKAAKSVHSPTVKRQESARVTKGSHMQNAQYQHQQTGVDNKANIQNDNGVLSSLEQRPNIAAQFKMSSTDNQANIRIHNKLDSGEYPTATHLSSTGMDITAYKSRSNKNIATNANSGVNGIKDTTIHMRNASVAAEKLPLINEKLSEHQYVQNVHLKKQNTLNRRHSSKPDVKDLNTVPSSNSVIAGNTDGVSSLQHDYLQSGQTNNDTTKTYQSVHNDTPKSNSHQIETSSVDTNASNRDNKRQIDTVSTSTSNPVLITGKNEKEYVQSIDAEKLAIHVGSAPVVKTNVGKYSSSNDLDTNFKKEGLLPRSSITKVSTTDNKVESHSQIQDINSTPKIDQTPTLQDTPTEYDTQMINSPSISNEITKRKQSNVIKTTPQNNRLKEKGQENKSPQLSFTAHSSETSNRHSTHTQMSQQDTREAQTGVYVQTEPVKSLNENTSPNTFITDSPKKYADRVDMHPIQNNMLESNSNLLTTDNKAATLQNIPPVVAMSTDVVKVIPSTISNSITNTTNVINVKRKPRVNQNIPVLSNVNKPVALRENMSALRRKYFAQALQRILKNREKHVINNKVGNSVHTTIQNARPSSAINDSLSERGDAFRHLSVSSLPLPQQIMSDERRILQNDIGEIVLKSKGILDNNMNINNVRDIPAPLNEDSKTITYDKLGDREFSPFINRNLHAAKSDVDRNSFDKKINDKTYDIPGTKSNTQIQDAANTSTDKNDTLKQNIKSTHNTLHSAIKDRFGKAGNSNEHNTMNRYKTDAYSNKIKSARNSSFSNDINNKKAQPTTDTSSYSSSNDSSKSVFEKLRNNSKYISLIKNKMNSYQNVLSKEPVQWNTDTLSVDPRVSKVVLPKVKHTRETSTLRNIRINTLSITNSVPDTKYVPGGSKSSNTIKGTLKEWKQSTSTENNRINGNRIDDEVVVNNVALNNKLGHTFSKPNSNFSQDEIKIVKLSANKSSKQPTAHQLTNDGKRRGVQNTSNTIRTRKTESKNIAHLSKNNESVLNKSDTIINSNNIRHTISKEQPTLEKNRSMSSNKKITVDATGAKFNILRMLVNTALQMPKGSTAESVFRQFLKKREGSSDANSMHISAIIDTRQRKKGKPNSVPQKDTIVSSEVVVPMVSESIHKIIPSESEKSTKQTSVYQTLSTRDMFKDKNALNVYQSNLAKKDESTATSTNVAIYSDSYSNRKQSNGSNSSSSNNNRNINNISNLNINPNTIDNSDIQANHAYKNLDAVHTDKNLNSSTITPEYANTVKTIMADSLQTPHSPEPVTSAPTHHGITSPEYTNITKTTKSASFLATQSSETVTAAPGHERNGNRKVHTLAESIAKLLATRAGSTPEGRCIVAPLCGSDGVTYISNCLLPVSVSKACNGRCPCSEQPRSSRQIQDASMIIKLANSTKQRTTHGNTRLNDTSYLQATNYQNNKPGVALSQKGLNNIQTRQDNIILQQQVHIAHTQSDNALPHQIETVSNNLPRNDVTQQSINYTPNHTEKTITQDSGQNLQSQQSNALFDQTANQLQAQPQIATSGNSNQSGYELNHHNTSYEPYEQNTPVNALSNPNTNNNQIQPANNISDQNVHYTHYQPDSVISHSVGGDLPNQPSETVANQSTQYNEVHPANGMSQQNLQYTQYQPDSAISHQVNTLSDQNTQHNVNETPSVTGVSQQNPHYTQYQPDSSTSQQVAGHIANTLSNQNTPHIVNENHPAAGVSQRDPQYTQYQPDNAIAHQIGGGHIAEKLSNQNTHPVVKEVPPGIGLLQQDSQYTQYQPDSPISNQVGGYIHNQPQNGLSHQSANYLHQLPTDGTYQQSRLRSRPGMGVANTNLAPAIGVSNQQAGTAQQTGGTSLQAQAMCFMSCSSVYDPVCSVKGNSHTNACIMTCSGEFLMCNGTCPCEYEHLPPAVQRTMVHTGRGEVEYGAGGVGAPGMVDTNPHGGGQEPPEIEPPEYPEVVPRRGRGCSCPRGGRQRVCTFSGQTYTRCRARCRNKTVRCAGRCPCPVSTQPVVEW